MKRRQRRVAPKSSAPQPPDPGALSFHKLAAEREKRRVRVTDAVKSAKTWGRNPRDRLRVALERLEHEKLMAGGLDQATYDKLRIGSRLARAERDRALPEFKYESRARTRRRRRAQLEVELWP